MSRLMGDLSRVAPAPQREASSAASPPPDGRCRQPKRGARTRQMTVAACMQTTQPDGLDTGSAAARLGAGGRLRRLEDCLLQRVSAVRRCLLVPSRMVKMSWAEFTCRSSTPCASRDRQKVTAMLGDDLSKRRYCRMQENTATTLAGKVISFCTLATWRTTPFFGSSRRRSLLSFPELSSSAAAIRSERSSLYNSTIDIRT